MHPAFDFMARECTQNYKIPNTNVIIEKGTPIYFSITGSLTDSTYYSEPDVFNPDRFNDNFDAKNSATRPYLGELFFINFKKYRILIDVFVVVAVVVLHTASIRRWTKKLHW